MSPLREYIPLNRAADVPRSGEFRIKYYVICEGQNTEWIYFTGMRNYQKELGINNVIGIIPLEKTDEHAGWSHPKKLFELAEKKRQELQKDYAHLESDDNKFVLVFDLDKLREQKPGSYAKFLENKKSDEIVVVTNPCFDLWMLLHKENAYEEYIKGNEMEILENAKKQKGKKHTFTSKLASNALGFNTKGKFDFAQLLGKIENAIQQEKHICENVEEMIDQIGCNMGLFVRELQTKRFE